MSYIRAGWDLTYVKGISEDYIYKTGGPKKGSSIIQDYGGISDTGLIEILCRCIDDSYSRNAPINVYLKKN